MSLFTINNGWLELDDGKAGDEVLDIKPSTHCDERECEDISLLVVHNISLPPGQFGSGHITDLFLGRLNPDEHDYFKDIYQIRVSAHCLIRRDGQVVQYVPFNKRAWHAGVSSFCDREKCNDFSIGIEMEGTDDLPYTNAQYEQLQVITKLLLAHYPEINTDRIVGHSDIAPGRKTDPGESFDWIKYKQGL
ncbi:1,6-anhydro-N-acetylmuramyl-L-alanine amidase AmpD [Thalassomonas sp. M1454]|uniref:1,6-anhydro-N-acetylmuramyl-L-alanine amidase AmpD n=1 Tax=Thalassomonas sp. M1454 TaxID=2594477 RepID=UPI00118020DB|nr:1,6-anhydro-N-acetylmuramyl-L-alanine amidase AmpD [Thalassomonas sp. M1454]TRX52697.1 1,6-anhydro-N-acetylmuramyl-L-alanine amidase AmpD [Thalassomonas sp. M1454]